MTLARLTLLAALLLSTAARGTELKLATWNIEWLTLRPAGDPALPHDVNPKRPEDLALLRRYAEILDADVVAFEEVDGPDTAARVFAPDRYALHVTADQVVQRTGLAIRRSLHFTANPDLTSLDVYPPQAKFQLRSGADITLDLPDGNKLRVLAVHLKTGCREDPLTRSTRRACETLGEQVAPLQGWIAQRRAEGVPFVVMGDFNRWMDGNDQLLAALRRAAPLARATEGREDPCWGGGQFIDHILAGGPARTWMQPQTLRVLVYRETDPAWKERLSDHCPVSVDFTLPP
ncbi:MAG: endonuclease/exonuclease/phosphatase family protein [Acidisphaera sp.]|nr:endonuclease/exonuclease/phosphatase family protein [Acidisphaera sp.]